MPQPPPGPGMEALPPQRADGPPDVLSTLAEQLKLAAQAYEACLARHALERRQCEAQVSKLISHLQTMSAGMVSPVVELGFKDRSEDTCGAPHSFQVHDVQVEVERDSFQSFHRHHVPELALKPEHFQRPEHHFPRPELSPRPGSLTPRPELSVQGSIQIPVPSTARVSRVSTPQVRQRLLMRFGRSSTGCLIRGLDLHQAVYALGLERYSLSEMDHLVQKLAAVVNLRFRAPERPDRPRLIKQVTQISQTSFDLHHRVLPRAGSSNSWLAEQAEWTWPEAASSSEWTWPDTLVGERTTWARLARKAKTSVLEDPHRVIPLQVLVKAMTADEVSLRRLLGSALCEQLLAVKEVLMTADANRLVSELTCVRIDDLATRRPKSEWSVFEPLVGVLLVLNGIAVGFQTDPDFADWPGWLGIEIAFTLMFLFELLARQAWYGFRAFWCGHDILWNLFDVLLLIVGIAECWVTAAGGSDLAALAIVRGARLFKLARVVRVFRLSITKDLQLMVKGLLGGLRTLCWAFVLLCFILYVLGVLTHVTFGQHEEVMVRELFQDIPFSMFTVFRCITGDCFTRGGSSITSLLQIQYGLAFSLSFFLAYIGIALGVFNVILAIYVEITMTAAKKAEGKQERESIRIAHITKRLLKLFCAAEEAANRGAAGDGVRPSTVKGSLAGDLSSTEINCDATNISKELFLMVVQEPEVQRLMDQLDIPPDRANLFESIDADGSGSLSASELVMGLLKVRGECKRSDQVACILAIRAVQSTLRQMDGELKASYGMLEHLNASYRTLEQLTASYRAARRESHSSWASRPRRESSCSSASHGHRPPSRVQVRHGRLAERARAVEGDEGGDPGWDDANSAGYHRETDAKGGMSPTASSTSAETTWRRPEYPVPTLMRLEAPPSEGA